MFAWPFAVFKFPLLGACPVARVNIRVDVFSGAHFLKSLLGTAEIFIKIGWMNQDRYLSCPAGGLSRWVSCAAGVFSQHICLEAN